MLPINELENIRLHQHIAEQMYFQQIMQRFPERFVPMLPIPVAHHMMVPPRPTLPGVEAKLDNDLWNKFHEIGTEMIITKCGRRMFPSMRVTLSGLDEEATYFVLLDMVPIGDCRFKFSGSHWVPAGGAEPQSPQRTILHPDSPATGAHWQSQAITFNKVKLTNNTLDSNGHIVLTSMHKYQPRLHIISASDLSQLPWAPQKAFVFSETEFVAVTAYQNERITKLKIDNNPFAKGFRETGQARCKRKTSLSNEELTPATEILTISNNNMSYEDDHSSISSYESSLHQKRLRSDGSSDDDMSSFASSSTRSSGGITPDFVEQNYLEYQASAIYHQQQQLQLFQHQHSSAMDIANAAGYHTAPAHLSLRLPMLMPASVQHSAHPATYSSVNTSAQILNIPPVSVVTPNEAMETSEIATSSTSISSTTQAKSHSFSISAILAD